MIMDYDDLIEQGQNCRVPDMKLTRALANTLSDMRKAWLAQRDQIHELEKTIANTKKPTTKRKKKAKKDDEQISS